MIAPRLIVFTLALIATGSFASDHRRDWPAPSDAGIALTSQLEACGLASRAKLLRTAMDEIVHRSSYPFVSNSIDIDSQILDGVTVTRQAADKAEICKAVDKSGEPTTALACWH